MYDLLGKLQVVICISWSGYFLHRYVDTKHLY